EINSKARELWKPNEIKQMLYVSWKERDMVMFVFESGLFGVIFSNSSNYSDYIVLKPKDGSKVFLNSVLITSNGRVVASTPTTYMIGSTTGKFMETYDELVEGNAPDLKNPTIREAKPGIIYIKDEVMKDLRVEIDISGKNIIVGVQPGD
ncbi:MAG: hypothetical protein N3F07_04335, partial [Candidatus Micrarchaeota archaeon]|nr:hypothetical protein [Candidatus Micrarchaeota archaeon]